MASSGLLQGLSAYSEGQRGLRTDKERMGSQCRISRWILGDGGEVALAVVRIGVLVKQSSLGFL